MRTKTPASPTELMVAKPKNMAKANAKDNEKPDDIKQQCAG